MPKLYILQYNIQSLTIRFTIEGEVGKKRIQSSIFESIIVIQAMFSSYLDFGTIEPPPLNIALFQIKINFPNHSTIGG